MTTKKKNMAAMRGEESKIQIVEGCEQFKERVTALRGRKEDIQAEKDLSQSRSRWHLYANKHVRI